MRSTGRNTAPLRRYFLPLAAGQKLWGSRFGKLTSIRIHGSADGFSRTASQRRSIRQVVGFSVFAARTQALAASEGATDFGEYFVYFSFFLMAAALLLAALFFRLSVEQRLREIGMLRAMGYSGRRDPQHFSVGGRRACGGWLRGWDRGGGGLRRADHARAAYALVWRGRDQAAFAACRAIGAGDRERGGTGGGAPLHLVDAARAALDYASRVDGRAPHRYENAGVAGARVRDGGRGSGCCCALDWGSRAASSAAARCCWRRRCSKAEPG